MEKLRTYYDFAMNDLKYAQMGIEHTEDTSSLNILIVTSLVQAAEKFLKHIIDCDSDCFNPTDNELLRTHSFTKLYERVQSIITLQVTRSQVLWLGEFNFTVEYPRYMAFNVVRDDVNDALAIVLSIKADVDNYLADYVKRSAEQKKILGAVKIDL